jgi:hypothetical protein
MMKHCGRILAPAIGLGLVLAFVPTVLASPIVYDASGTFGKGAFRLGGTVTLDPSDTTFIANFDLTVSPIAQAPIVGPPPLLSGIAPYSGDSSITEIGALYTGSPVSSGIGLAFNTTDLQAGGIIDLLSKVAKAKANKSGFPPPLGYTDSNGSTVNIDPGGLLTPASTPEPATLTLMGLGLFAVAGFGLCRRRPGAA